MSLYVIGDLHLSLGTDKPMDIFSGWDNYVSRLTENWNKNINDDDTIVIPGDISWAMSLKNAVNDFDYINKLPGKKIISKGNHDYWWSTMSKINTFLTENGFDKIQIMHNNHYKYENYGICGTRGWINENGEPQDAKVLAREAARLETSIKSALNEELTPLVFLHYPPIYATSYNYSMLEILHKYDIKKCWYGHIHGNSCKYAINGERDGIEFQLISSDFIQFNPYKIL